MTDLRIKRAPRTLDIKIDKPDVIVHLKARKTIAGDVMIYDHPDIDIVVSPKENKVSLEGPILVAEEAQKEQVDPLQIVIYSVAKFLQEEAPHTRGYKEYEAEFDKELTDPAEDETTELGKVPHEPRKGTNHTYPGSTAAYGLVGYHYEE